MLTKNGILKKTSQISAATLLSRFLGIIRERLMIELLGASALSDAFLTAYKVPNSLRKVFAEGALTSALLPTLITRFRTQGRDSVGSLMTLCFLVFETILLLLCGLVMWKAEPFIGLIAPGFDAPQIATTAACLRILMPFIFFLSTSALLSTALQAVGHFLIHAFSPVILNIVIISSLALCLMFNLSIYALCWFHLLAGLIQLICHLVVYFAYQFNFTAINRADFNVFGLVLGKFGACLLSASVMEISLFVDTSFASTLPSGSISLITYANRLMGIPLGVFAVAFSTVILTHFSRVASYAPRRLGFYILESMKFVLWITLPATLFMIIFSRKIFYTIFFSSKFSHAQVNEAALILSAFVIGLFFFSINKILLNVYYSLHNTWIPAVISIVATIANIVFNYLMITHLHAFGLALATTLSAVLQTALSLWILHASFGLKLYTGSLVQFIIRYTILLACCFGAFGALFLSAQYLITFLPASLRYFLSDTILFWTWVGPLCCGVYLLQHVMRKRFGVRIYFIER